MKIVSNSNRKIKLFGELEQGQVFRVGDDVFIKVEFDKKSDINAVKLDDGAKYLFRSYFDKAEPLNATLLIEE